MATFGKIGQNLTDTKTTYREGFRQRNVHVRPETDPVWKSTVYDVSQDEESKCWNVKVKDLTTEGDGVTSWKDKLDRALNLDVLPPQGATICVHTNPGSAGWPLYLTTSRKFRITQFHATSENCCTVSEEEESILMEISLQTAHEWVYIDVRQVGVYTMIICHGEADVSPVSEPTE